MYRSREKNRVMGGTAWCSPCESATFTPDVFVHAEFRHRLCTSARFTLVHRLLGVRLLKISPLTLPSGTFSLSSQWARILHADVLVLINMRRA